MERDSLSTKLVLSFFNNVEKPEEILEYIFDDPNFGKKSKMAIGIRKSLAKRIIDTRKRLPKKKFTSIDEIDSIKGVGKDTLHDISSMFETIKAKKSKTEDNENLSLDGVLKDPKNKNFNNHYVEINYEEEVEIGFSLEDESKKMWKHSSQRAAVNSENKFSFVLPPKESMKDLVILKVLFSDGQVLTTKEYGIDELKNIEILIEAREPNAPIEIEESNLGRRTRISGTVLDKNGKKKISNKQVIIWAVPKGGTEETSPIPLLATDTDKNGHFSGDYPTGEYSEAYATVGFETEDGENEQKIGIPLIDFTFPKNLLLLVDAPENLEDLDSGDSRIITPPIADNEDLINSPSAYSNVLGLGRCVNMNTPNRVLEEFDYYMVVRTSEPQIKGLTVSEPVTKIPKHLVSSFFKAKLTIEEHKKSITDYRKSFSATANPLRSREVSSTSRTARTRTSSAPNPAVANDQPSAVPRRGKISLENLFNTKVNANAFRNLMMRDPDKLSPESLIDAEVSTAQDHLHDTIESLQKKVPERAELNAKNYVDWDYTPTFYQAATIAHGHLLHFKQIWHAADYSLGDLLYSLPLAPCQKKQIAIIDWERRESARRTEFLEEQERFSALMSRDRDISEVVNSVLSENMKGGSRASTKSGSAGFGIPLLGGLLGASGGASSANTSAWQNSSRRMGASSLQRLKDKTMQSASAVRNQRSTVVQSVKQGETVRAQTEVVSNNNHCHAITVQYFEVLRHFYVTQEIADVQECLFIPMLMSKFNNAKIVRWKEEIIPFLQDRSLSRAFDAAERIDNNYEGSNRPAGQYSEENIDYLEGELRISFNIARPKDKDDKFDPDAWGFWTKLFGGNVDDIYNRYLKDQNAKDRIFQDQLASRIAEKIVASLEFYANDDTSLPIDATLVSDYTDDVSLYVSLRQKGDLPPLSRESIRSFKIDSKTKKEISIGNISFVYDLLPKNSKMVVRSGSMRYRTQNFSYHLFRDSRILNDLTSTDPVRINTPLGRAELRNPREEDKELTTRLKDHLNSHLVYYHKVIWSNMDADRRYMLLDGFVAPGSNGRSVASVVENRLIGIVGNSLVMPVAPGNNLNPIIKQNSEKPIDLLNIYAPDTPVSPMRISVPTKGVFAEAVMGSCNSCEEKDDSRFWRFEESPCGDFPTPINPLSTESRRTDPGNLQSQPLPTPMINLQNAPPAPDPTGLGAALKILGNQNIFKDITGVEGTQANAINALRSAFDATKFFGAEAVKLAKQENAIKNSDKILGTIDRAEKKKDISPETAKKGRISHVEEITGSKKEETSVDYMPDVPKSIDELIDRGGKGSWSDGSKSFKFEMPVPVKEASWLGEDLETQLYIAVEKAKRFRTKFHQKDGFTVQKVDGKYHMVGSFVIANFDVNKVELKKEHKDAIDKLTDILNSSSSAQCVLIGRASQTGPELNNQKLSINRAGTIAKHLKNEGVSAAKLTDSVGVASKIPIKNAPDVEEAINRSVEVLFAYPAPNPKPPKLPDPKPSENPKASRKWGVKFWLDITGSTPVVGPALSEIVGTLKNLKTGETKSIRIPSHGGGVGLSFIPFNISPFGKFTEFETKHAILIDDFKKQPVYIQAKGYDYFFGGKSYVEFKVTKISSTVAKIKSTTFLSVGINAKFQTGWIEFNEL